MEKDGTGSCTTKPKSEWRTKKSGRKRPYWEQWNTKDDNLSDEEQQRQEKLDLFRVALGTLTQEQRDAVIDYIGICEEQHWRMVEILL